MIILFFLLIIVIIIIVTGIVSLLLYALVISIREFKKGNQSLGYLFLGLFLLFALILSYIIMN